MPEYSSTKRYQRGFLSIVFRLPNAPFQNRHSWQPRKSVLNLQHMKSDVQLRVVNLSRQPCSMLLSTGVARWSRPMEAAPSRLSAASPGSTLPNEPAVSHEDALPRPAADRRLQCVQCVQWLQWIQWVQYLLESLVRHLKPRRASLLVVKLLVDKEAKGRLAEGRISSRRPTVVPHKTMKAGRRGLRIAVTVIGF